MLFRAVTVALLILGIVLFFAGVQAAIPKHPAGAALVYTSAPRYDVTAWLHGGERFPEGAHLMLRSGHVSRPLEPAFFASADASISFDGTRVLFAGKKNSGDHWQIWEAAIAGGDAVRLTSCADDCVRPLFLPEDRIVYAHKIDGQFQLEDSPVSAGGPLRLTYEPGNALPTDVLHDGRVLFEANYPMGEGATPELYTVYPDGSGVESYRCDHGDSRHSGKQLSSGDIVFVNDNGMARFTSALAHEEQIKSPAGEFAGDLIEAPDGNWITSWRANSQGHYSLREWNRLTNAFRTLAADNGADLVQPQIVVPRAVPNRFPSGLHDWDSANVLCLNAYTSKLKIASGSVESVNLYTQRNGQPELLGNAHVESDGSFFLHVPGDRPLQIDLLDASGKTVQRERGWFWMRRGEQRVCVGCHAGPERAPENAVPQVLVKSTVPADMTKAAVLNAQGGR